MPLVNYSVRIRGNGVAPDTVRASDLAELLQLLEQLFVETAKAEHEGGTSGLPPEKATFSLVAIAEGSNVLTLTLDESFGPSLEVVDDAIRRGHVDRLPDRAYGKLLSISNWAVKHDYDIDFGELDSPATLSHEDPVRRSEVQGTTTLYGECLRIGGDKPPTMRLRLLSGVIVTCKVNASMAQELGKLLYKEIGVEGIASWTHREMRLRRFEVTRLLPYRNTGVLEAFQELADAGGRAWTNVADVEAWVDEQRGMPRQ